MRIKALRVALRRGTMIIAAVKAMLLKVRGSSSGLSVERKPVVAFKYSTSPLGP